MCTLKNDYFNCRMDFLFKSDERHVVILKKALFENNVIHFDSTKSEILTNHG